MAHNTSGQSHSRIENDWLDDNANDKNAVHECEYLDGQVHSKTRAGIPRAIMIGGDSTDAGNIGTVRGYLWGENTKQTDDYMLAPYSLISLAFKRIYARGTTARWIKIFY